MSTSYNFDFKFNLPVKSGRSTWKNIVLNDLDENWFNDLSGGHTKVSANLYLTNFVFFPVPGKITSVSFSSQTITSARTTNTSYPSISNEGTALSLLNHFLQVGDTIDDYIDDFVDPLITDKVVYHTNNDTDSWVGIKFAQNHADINKNIANGDLLTDYCVQWGTNATDDIVILPIDLKVTVAANDTRIATTMDLSKWMKEQIMSKIAHYKVYYQSGFKYIKDSKYSYSV